MSLKSIRNQINALRRKFAFPLAVLRLRRISEDFCHDWHTALTNNKPVPEPHPFILKIAKEVLPLNTFMSLHHYLNRHRDNKTTPEPRAIAVTLFPHHANSLLFTHLFAGELTPRPKPAPPFGIIPRNRPQRTRAIDPYTRAITRQLRETLRNPRECGNPPKNDGNAGTTAHSPLRGQPPALL